MSLLIRQLRATKVGLKSFFEFEALFFMFLKQARRIYFEKVDISFIIIRDDIFKTLNK